MSKESAVEILVYKPGLPVPPEQRGVHENLWIKKHFKHYVSIGVYLEGPDLQYYFFEDCDNSPKIYSSLLELKEDLPKELGNLFDKSPKLFVMGHGRGDCYGLGNYPVEIVGEDFDKIITHFKAALPKRHDEVIVTLEACNTDNTEQAQRGGQEKTFLARLSETHQAMTICGTGPWDPEDPQTGYRASGGFPTLNVPITAMNGGTWKYGNSVIFHHDAYQVIVVKSRFASTKTAKALKTNTIEYAREALRKTALDEEAKNALIRSLCVNRDVLNIQDLKSVPGFPQEKFEGEAMTTLLEKETKLLGKEKNKYLRRVQAILTQAESGENFSDRDLLIMALGLKDFAESRELSVFKDHEDLLNDIVTNKDLLQLIMVTCGKVLIAGPSNDALIDWLLDNEIDVNSVDKQGMTALHHAAQSFYNYREEPLNLIQQLLDSEASLKASDSHGRTPLSLAAEHSQKGNVTSGDSLLELFEQRQVLAHSRVGSLGFFKPQHSLQDPTTADAYGPGAIVPFQPY